MERIVSDQKSPLEILMTVMRDRFAKQEFDSAVAIAKAVAPFVHPKPRAREGGETIAALRDQQLVDICRAGVARAGAAEKDPH
jgi:hypothetical protein